MFSMCLIMASLVRLIIMVPLDVRLIRSLYVIALTEGNRWLKHAIISTPWLCNVLSCPCQVIIEKGLTIKKDLLFSRSSYILNKVVSKLKEIIIILENEENK